MKNKKNNPSQIIAISGQIASGTSTVSKKLAKKLEYKYLDVGQIFRKLAKEQKGDVISFQKTVNNNKKIDLKIEAETILFIKKHKKVVLNGKLTPWFLNQKKIESFSVFLTASLETRIKRIRTREPELSYKAAKKHLLSRERQHRQRWRKSYNLDRNNLSIYNLIIDTSKIPVDEVLEKVLEKLS